MSNLKVYLDHDFKCHLTDDNTVMSVEIKFFDNKCDAFIEGYRFIPAGKSWTREDGIVFNGEMIAPWKSYEELDAAQRQYEQELAEAARILLGGN